MMVRMFTFCRLVCLLLPVLSFVRVESTLYYELVPYITLKAPGLGSETLIGDFASYSNHPDTQDSPLVFVPDDFGCPTWNDTINTSSHPRFTLILRLTQDCTDYEQASAAQQLGAEGVIFYYTRGSEYDTLGSKPDSESRQIRIAVVSLELDEDDVQELMANTSPTVSIQGEYRQSFQTSHTFYFVVFAFCILMLLSCLWFALSYIKRCHYNVQNRRRRVQNETETRLAMSKLAVRTHKTSKSATGDDQTCVICLDPFCNNDAIRILPCKHEFHKKCVDPWLKLKRTCPICKQNITNDNRRRMAAGSTSSISSVSSGATQESSLQEEEEVQSMEQQQSVQVAVDIDQESVSVPNTMAFV